MAKGTEPARPVAANADRQRQPRRKRSAPAGNGSQQAGGDRRTEILAIAARRFAARGFEPTTIREIADDANILSGSIYHHFETKEEILDEIIRETILLTKELTLKIAAADATAEERLVAMMLVPLMRLRSHRAVQAILYHERKFFPKSPRFSYVAEAVAEMFQAWQAVLQDGVDENLFRPDTNLFLTAATINRLLHASSDWTNPEEPHYQRLWEKYPLDSLIDFELSFVLEAVRARRRRALAIPRAKAEQLIKNLSKD